VATEPLFFPVEIPSTLVDVIYPLAVIPTEFSGTKMGGMTIYTREATPSLDGNLWLLDVGTLAPSGSYVALSTTLPLAQSRGVLFWEQEIQFEAGSVPAARVRAQGFPAALNPITLIPHFRVRGGRRHGQAQD
jgi:hypothetical protein